MAFSLDYRFFAVPAKLVGCDELITRSAPCRTVHSSGPGEVVKVSPGGVDGGAQYLFWVEPRAQDRDCRLVWCAMKFAHRRARCRLCNFFVRRSCEP